MDTPPRRGPPDVGDAEFVYPPLRRESRRVSGYSEGEGRKTVEVSERDRVEVFCGKCGNM